jgi:hypothetical protein
MRNMDYYSSYCPPVLYCIDRAFFKLNSSHHVSRTASISMSATSLPVHGLRRIAAFLLTKQKMDSTEPKRQWTGNSRSSRKRRRRGPSGSGRTNPGEGATVGSDAALLCHSSGDQASSVTATADKQGRGSHQPLSGLLVAVSSLSSEASEQPLQPSRSAKAAGPPATNAEADETLDSSTYNALVELCQLAGTRTTSQVHRRVQVVVASPAAVHRQSQRVRKAWKLSIPVVRPSWVHRCLELKQKVDWTDYLYPMLSGKLSRDEPGRKEGSLKSVVPKPSSSVVAQAVDLGCCCFCHESDSNDECPWCVDCGFKKVGSR